MCIRDSVTDALLLEEQMCFRKRRLTVNASSSVGMAFGHSSKVLGFDSGDNIKPK